MILLASNHLTARALLLRALGLPQLPALAYGPRGKPYLPASPEVHFNLSHSGGLALCGVGRHPLGVDIEQVRPRSLRLPGFALSAEEYGQYEAWGGDWAAFYTLWTQKEAFCKQQGGGVARPRTVCLPDGGDMRVFSGDGWRGAVYAPEEEIPPLLWV